MHLGSWKIDDLLTFYAQVCSPASGTDIDADTPPTYRIYEDETGTPILTGTMAVLDDSNTAGWYSEQITLSAANGFERGKSYTVRKTATVSGVSASMFHFFQIGAAVDVAYISTDATAADNLETMLDGTGGQTLSLKQLNIVNSAGDAIVASATGGNGSGIKASGNGTGEGIKATGGATGNGLTVVGGATSGHGIRATVTSGNEIDADIVGNITGNITGNLSGSVGSLTTNNDKTGYRLSATGVDDVLDEVVEGSTTFRQMLRGFAAALLAKLSGGGTTTNTFRDIGDTKNRITATVDSNGNRTAITTDLT